MRRRCSACSPRRRRRAPTASSPRRSIERLLRLAEVARPLAQLGEDDRTRGRRGAARADRLRRRAERDLQRMLYDAGISPEQLGAIADNVDGDAAFRVELWVLAEELLWQLHAEREPAEASLAGDRAGPAASGGAGGLVRRRHRARRRPRKGLKWRARTRRDNPRPWIFSARFSTSSCTSTCTSRPSCAHYGAWVYALLFAIIFIETGVVVMPFLPGDSLLFVVGAMCAAGLMSLPLVLGAALGGGGARQPEQLRDRPRDRAARVPVGELALVQPQGAFDQAHAFYEKYGGVDHHRRALHAVPAHLRAVRRRRRAR